LIPAARHRFLVAIGVASLSGEIGRRILARAGVRTFVPDRRRLE
jgi:hypothetical protein